MTVAKKAPLDDHRWVFYYDSNCGLCRGAVRVLAMTDFFRLVQWVPFQSLEEPPRGLSWEDLDRAAYLDTGQGVLHEGFYGIRMLTLRLLPLLPLAPVFWFPWMNSLGTAVYRWIARNRYRISRCRKPALKIGRRTKGPRSGEYRATDQPSEAP